VDATQIVREDSLYEDECEKQQETFEDRKKRNSEFLQQSWENIIENDVEETLLIQNLEEHESNLQQDNPPFKIVTSKKRTPTKKTNPSISKTSYQTRSKVPNPKPFK